MISNATLFVCEDIRFEADGKFIVIGTYTRDISIVPGPYPVKRLLFLFNADGPLSSLPKKLEFEVTLPGAQPRRAEIQPPAFEDTPGRTRWYARGIVQFTNEILYPGQIFAKAISDGLETEVVAPWIVLNTAVANAPVKATS